MPPQQSVTISNRRSFDVLSSWALIVTVVAALVMIIPSSSASFAATKTFVLAGGSLITLALFILARLTRGNVVFPSSALMGALWFPVIAYALSAAFSGVRFGNALWGSALESDTLGFMLVAAVLGTLSTLVLKSQENYKSFFKVSAYVFGAIVLLQTLILLIGQFSPNTIPPAFSLVGSFGDLASFLGLGVISVLITLRFLDPAQKVRRALIVAGALSLFLLAIANSSLVWTLLALTSLGFFVETVMRRGSKVVDSDLDETILLDEMPVEATKGERSPALPLSVLVVSLFFLIGGTLGGALANSLHINILNIRPSWQSTLSVAQKTLGTSPLLGSGPSTFGAEWLKYREASLNSTLFWNIDFSSGVGFIPTSFVTTGILGVIAWLAFLGMFIVYGLRMLISRTPQEAFIRYAAITSFIASVYLFTIALFDLPSTVILTLAFVFAGLFISTMRFAANGQQKGIVFSRSPRLGFVIVFGLTLVLLSSVVVAYNVVGRYVALTQLANASKAFSAGNLDAAAQAAQSSISFAPSAAAYEIQASIARAHLDQVAGSSTMPATAAQKSFQDALSAGINAALTATSLNAADYQSWMTLGNLYAQAVPLGVTGAYTSAKTAYDKAAALNPTNPQIPYIIAQLNIANKDTKAAEDSLKAAITLKPDYADAIFLLSQLEVQDGNIKEALASSLAAAYFMPNNANILFQVGVLYAAQNDLVDAAAALKAAIDANSQFANARFFLAAVYAKGGDLKDALAQMQAISDLSSDNAKAIAPQIADLKAGKNPFPANLLSAPTPVK